MNNSMITFIIAFFGFNLPIAKSTRSASFIIIEASAFPSFPFETEPF